MNIIAVDDERLALDNAVALLKKAAPDAEVNGFLKSAAAFAYLSEHHVDIAVLDIKMAGLNGIALARKCKDLCPALNIIFATGYSEYAMDALKLHASGYIMKPIRMEDLRYELDNLRNPPCHPSGESRVRVQTFGNFEFFVDGQPVKWPRTKSKECLAYLIDRKGATATIAEISAVLWEDRPYDRALQNNTQKVLSDMMKVLKDAGVQDIVIKSRNRIAIDTAKVDCDYYRFLEMDMMAVNSYCGQYMANYSWAQLTLGELERKTIYE